MDMNLRRAVSRLAPVLLGLALLAGCATGPGEGPGGSAPPTPTASPGCPEVVRITEADASATVCLGPTGTATLTLHGSGWAPVVLDGDSVVIAGQSASADARTATVRAVRAGSTQVRSSRSVCPPPSSGAAACHALQAFQVTVTVR